MADPVIFSTLKSAWQLAAYIGLGLAILAARFVPWTLRMAAFAALNIGVVFYGWFWQPKPNVMGFAVLAGLTVAHWAVLHVMARSGKRDGALYWAAFLSPILLLIVFKGQSLLQVVGASYMAFRMAQTAFEMSSDEALTPNFFEYLAFLFFPPTLAAGPISPFSYFRATADGGQISQHNIGWGLMRVAIGFIKFAFLATLVQQLTFTQHWDGGFKFGGIDFTISAIAYYLYLYLNFSGYTDVAVGAGAIMGLRVRENFDNPLVARNIMDFWRRWHLSLTEFVRDAVFTPMTMSLTRWLGPAFADVAMVSATVVTFTIFALWHGVAAGYFIFYGLHAAAFVLNHFSDKFLRSRGKGVRAAYLANPYYKFGSQVLTFLFVALTCALLELRTWDRIKSVFAAL